MYSNQQKTQPSSQPDHRRCLLLDIGGVLARDIMQYDWIDNLAKQSHLDPYQLSGYYQLFLKEPLFTGQTNTHQFWQQLSKYTKQPNLESQLEPGVIQDLQPLPAMQHLAAWQQQVKVGILSNHVLAWLQSRADLQAIFTHTDFQLISDQTGWRKPQPEAFRLALQTAHTTPDQILFVDNQQSNLNQASLLGMHTRLADPDARWTEYVEHWIEQPDL